MHLKTRNVWCDLNYLAKVFLKSNVDYVQSQGQTPHFSPHHPPTETSGFAIARWTKLSLFERSYGCYISKHLTLKD